MCCALMDTQQQQLRAMSEADFRLIGLTPDLPKPKKRRLRLTLSWARKLGVYPTELGEQRYVDLSLIFPFIGFPSTQVITARARRA